MKLRRAVRMSVAEISCRARQEVSKWLDRRAGPPRSTLVGAIPADVIAQCLEEMPARFFPGASDPRVPAILLERCPESGPRLAAAADRTLQKQFEEIEYRQADVKSEFSKAVRGLFTPLPSPS